jgi:hypothetical protein
VGGGAAGEFVRVIGKVSDAYTTRTSHLKKGLLGRKGSKRREIEEHRGAG